MKKIALLLAVALSSVTVFAQSINKNELKQLQNFLSQPAVHHATNAEALKITNVNDPSTWEGVTVANGRVTRVRIAVARDKAFCFYYEDNLDAMRQMGAELVEFSPLHDKKLPEEIHGTGARHRGCGYRFRGAYRGLGLRR